MGELNPSKRAEAFATDTYCFGPAIMTGQVSYERPILVSK